MAKLLTAYIPEISFLVRGCPSVVITNSVRLAAQRFCEESKFWRVTPDPVSVIFGIPDYDLDIPANTVVVAPVWATLLKQPLAIATDRSLSFTRPGSPVQVYVEDAMAYLSPQPDTDGIGALVVRVAIKPTALATDIDERIVYHFNDAIVWGALSELLAMSGFDWYDMTKSNYYESRFREAISKARQKGSGADGPVVRTVKYGGY